MDGRRNRQGKEERRHQENDDVNSARWLTWPCLPSLDCLSGDSVADIGVNLMEGEENDGGGAGHVDSRHCGSSSIAPGS